jgi:hypothetical protein
MGVIPQRCHTRGTRLHGPVRLHDLEVGFVDFIINIHAGMLPTHSVFKGMNTVAGLFPYNYIELIMGKTFVGKKLFPALNPNSGIRADLPYTLLSWYG